MGNIYEVKLEVTLLVPSSQNCTTGQQAKETAEVVLKEILRAADTSAIVKARSFVKK